jgi:hypothetical protein
MMSGNTALCSIATLSYALQQSDEICSHDNFKHHVDSRREQASGDGG